MLDQGVVVERGTHEELWELGGVYASLLKTDEGDASVEGRMTTGTGDEHRPQRRTSRSSSTSGATVTVVEEGSVAVFCAEVAPRACRSDRGGS